MAQVSGSTPERKRGDGNNSFKAIPLMFLSYFGPNE